MSLPLRHPLENVSSLDRVFEDLLVRFVINCPPEDLSSVERELFHFEEASWFYTDFVKLMNPTLPSFKIKSFAKNIIKLCPLVWKWDIQADEALQKFSQYKKSIPVRGAAIFNEKLNKILLVKGTESDSWSFPRGKISKDEDDVACCIREVKEEIGYDLTDYIDENQFVERNIQGKNYKIFIVSGVPEDYNFKPQVRNEIEKIEWRDFKKIQKTMHKSTVRYYLINSMMRPLSLWVRRQRHNVGDDQLKQYAEDQLKLLLGITKEEQVDPGRELLNMLHSAVYQQEEKLDEQVQPQAQPQQQQQPQQQPQPQQRPEALQNTTTHPPPPPPPAPPMVNQIMLPQMVPPTVMGFHPFAPFPFMNGGVPFMSSQIIPGGPPPDQHQAQSGLLAGGTSQTLPTPDVSSLSRPVFAQQANVQQRSESSSKQLLALLNSKKESEGRPDSCGLAMDSGAIPREMAPSPHLTNGPQSKQEPSIPNDTATEDEVSLQDEGPSDEYEDFESGSESSDNEQRLQDKLKNDDDVYEDFERYAEEPSKAKVLDYLPRNDQKAPYPVVVQDAPHQKDILKRTTRNTFPEDSPAPKETAKPKPKIKLLKRGENLADVLPKQSSPSLTTEKSPSSEDLLNLLKKPYNSNNSQESPEQTPQQLHQTTERPVEQRSLSYSRENVLSSEIDKQQSPEEELMRLLKRTEEDISLQPEESSNDKGSQQLLDILKNPLFKNSSTSPALEPSASLSEGLSDDQPISSTSQPASSELLDILKNPPNGNSPKTVQMAYGFVGDPFKKETPYGSTASNELLGILHRK